MTSRTPRRISTESEYGSSFIVSTLVDTSIEPASEKSNLDSMKLNIVYAELYTTNCCFARRIGRGTYRERMTVVSAWKAIPGLKRKQRHLWPL